MAGSRRFPTVAAALLAAVIATGCTTGCPAALLEGTLVATPDGELLVKQDVSGTLWPVEWPGGYRVSRLDDGRLAVVDLFGGVKAAEGDRVGIGGGTDASDEVWMACGNMDSLVR